MTDRLSDGASAYVAEAAVAWDQARRECNRLRGERGSLACEREAEAEYDDHGRCTAEAEAPCWKAWWQDKYGEDRRAPIEEWCQPCQQRQRVHDNYRLAVIRRGALLRVLQRRALTAWESTKEIQS